MFGTFYNDLTYLPKTQFNAKYTVPFLISLLACVLVGQLITILIPLNQLNKVSGRIINMETDVISWRHNRGSSHDSPNYALVITLDNTHAYNIEDQYARAKLGSILKNGDYITIYYPTLTLMIISANLARDVSQVQRGDTVLYSWQEQKKEVWYIVGFLVVVIAIFYWLMGYLRNYMDASTLK